MPDVNYASRWSPDQRPILLLLVGLRTNKVPLVLCSMRLSWWGHQLRALGEEISPLQFLSPRSRFFVFIRHSSFVIRNNLYKSVASGFMPNVNYASRWSPDQRGSFGALLDEAQLVRTPTESFGRGNPAPTLFFFLYAHASLSLSVIRYS